MEYRKFGNTIIARIDKGEEILEQVKEIALKENIKLASIQALGAINDFTAGVFKTDEKKYYSNHFTGSFEIGLPHRDHQHHGRRILQSFTYKRRK